MLITTQMNTQTDKKICSIELFSLKTKILNLLKNQPHSGDILVEKSYPQESAEPRRGDT